jgi:hypothetical protein
MGLALQPDALAEIPDVDPAHIDELIRDWNSAPPNKASEHVPCSLQQIC